jgi:glycosyltransferase involved in cell wall biosynthesis
MHPLRTGPLRIGLIAPPWVPVPPKVYGGTELVIDELARGFERAGHCVDLFATGDSTCPVRRGWVHETAVGTTGNMVDELGHVEQAYRALAHCDVVHDHTLLGPLWATANTLAVPVATTAHGTFTPELSSLYRSVAQHVAVIAISRHQRSTAPSVPVRTVIHHGIDLAERPFGNGDGGYVLFLGRMHPDKGVHRAIEIARAAGRRILIAAKMWEPPEHRYFEEMVEPLLGSDAEYLGPVGHDDKIRLLGDAEALVNPIRWPEPFGLVMIEALAAGTPVLTFAEGAAPEIVDHATTGFLCRDDDDMVDRLGAVDTLDRRACRRAAEERFSTQKMVDGHLDVYHSLVEHRLADVRA